MLTAQNYAGWNCYAISPTGPLAVRPDSGPSIPPQQFVDRHRDIDPLNWLDLTDRFRFSPVRYQTILDALILFRGLMANVDTNFASHYALLINKHGFVYGIHRFNPVEDNKELDYLPADTLPVDQFGALLDMTNCSAVVLFSTTHISWLQDTFSESDLAFIDKLYDDSEQDGIELIDWILASPDGNTSWVWQIANPEHYEISPEGVNWFDTFFAGLDSNHEK